MSVYGLMQASYMYARGLQWDPIPCKLQHIPAESEVSHIHSKLNRNSCIKDLTTATHQQHLQEEKSQACAASLMSVSHIIQKRQHGYQTSSIWTDMPGCHLDSLIGIQLSLGCIHAVVVQTVSVSSKTRLWACDMFKAHMSLAYLLQSSIGEA